MFEEEILSDSELSREFPEEDDRLALESDGEMGGEEGEEEVSVGSPEGQAGGEEGEEQEGQAGEREQAGGSRGERAALGRRNKRRKEEGGAGSVQAGKRRRGAEGPAADAHTMPPPPPRQPAAAAASAASRRQRQAATLSAGGASTIPLPASPASAAAAAAAAPSGATVTEQPSPGSALNVREAGASPAMEPLQAFGAVLAPLDAPGTAGTTAATAPIACRTRARHDLGDIPIEDLERMLRVGGPWGCGQCAMV